MKNKENLSVSAWNMIGSLSKFKKKNVLKFYKTKKNKWVLKFPKFLTKIELLEEYKTSLVYTMWIENIKNKEWEITLTNGEDFKEVLNLESVYNQIKDKLVMLYAITNGNKYLIREHIIGKNNLDIISLFEDIIKVWQNNEQLDEMFKLESISTPLDIESITKFCNKYSQDIINIKVKKAHKPTIEVDKIDDKIKYFVEYAINNKKDDKNINLMIGSPLSFLLLKHNITTQEKYLNLLKDLDLMKYKQSNDILNNPKDFKFKTVIKRSDKPCSLCSKINKIVKIEVYSSVIVCFDCHSSYETFVTEGSL